MPVRSWAVRVHEHGGPEKMVWEQVELPDPGPGQALVRQTAIGFNFIDIYHRTGLYPQSLPITLGTEGAGVIEAVGKGALGLKVGQRVAYGTGGPGAYAERRLIGVQHLVPLPKDIPDAIAAAAMLKGMTAEYLVRRTHKVKRGDTILVHAAAGGVGLILCQWARHLGATVIGTVSTDEKAMLAKKHGCKHVLVVPREDFAARVREITKGKGVPVVYDSVGKDTFDKSLDSLAPLGVLALFGQSSGTVPPISPGILAKGSTYLTRPTLFVYNAARENLLASSRALFAVIRSGAVKIRVNHTYPLKEAARAHEDVAARRTTGSVVLTP